MRITNNMLISNMTYNLNGTLQRLERLQFESSVGKKFRVPSDDPIGASKSLKFNTDISKVEQYLRNSKDASSWMKETETALMEINEVLKRTYELTNQAANSTNSPDDLAKIKDEIKELKGHIIQVSNSTYAGRSLFTGFKTDKPLLDEDGNYNVSIENNEIFVYNVGVAETVPVNILGNKVFGSVKADGTADYTTNTSGPVAPSSGEKAYLVKVFDDLELALGTSDQEGLQKALGNVKGSMEQVLSITSEVGAKSNRLNLTTNKLEDQLINLKESLSFNEDVSLPEAMMRLAIEENVYNASLAVGAKIIQPTLMDFLR